MCRRAGQQCWIAQRPNWFRLRFFSERVDLEFDLSRVCRERDYDNENDGFVHPVAQLIEQSLSLKTKRHLSLVHWSFFNRRGCDCN